MPHHSSRKYGGKKEYGDVDMEKYQAYSSTDPYPDMDEDFEMHTMRCATLKQQLDAMPDGPKKIGIQSRFDKCVKTNTLTVKDVRQKHRDHVAQLISFLDGTATASHQQQAYARASIIYALNLAKYKDDMATNNSSDITKQDLRELRKEKRKCFVAMGIADGTYGDRRKAAIDQRKQDREAQKTKESKATTAWLNSQWDNPTADNRTKKYHRSDRRQSGDKSKKNQKERKGSAKKLKSV